MAWSSTTVSQHSAEPHAQHSRSQQLPTLRETAWGTAEITSFTARTAGLGGTPPDSSASRATVKVMPSSAAEAPGLSLVSAPAGQSQHLPANALSMSELQSEAAQESPAAERGEAPALDLLTLLP